MRLVARCVRHVSLRYCLPDGLSQRRQKTLDPGCDGCVVADRHGLHGRRPLRDISCNALVNCGARLPATPGDARGKKLGRRHHLDNDEAWQQWWCHIDCLLNNMVAIARDAYYAGEE